MGYPERRSCGNDHGRGSVRRWRLRAHWIGRPPLTTAAALLAAGLLLRAPTARAACSESFPQPFTAAPTDPTVGYPTTYVLSTTVPNVSGCGLVAKTVLTVTFPDNANVGTITSGTLNGNALTFNTLSGQTATFNAPLRVNSGKPLSIVLNMVTNGTLSGSKTLSMSATHTYNGGVINATDSEPYVLVPPTVPPSLTPTETPTDSPTPGPSTPPPPTATPTPALCGGTAPNNPCITGGGSRRTDCALEWLATPVPLLRQGTPRPSVNRKGFPFNRIICYEGDPRCDVDPNISDDSCTIVTRLCINNNDPRLDSCTPVDLASFEVKRPNPAHLLDSADSTNLATLENVAATGFGVTVVRRGVIQSLGTSNNTPDLCSDPLDILVPLRVASSGARRTGHKTLRVRAINSLGDADTDSLHLICRPSTCGDGRIQSNHETCDDGNRQDGDGCNQACQIEPGYTCTGEPSSCKPLPTDTPTALPPTATPTDTNTPAGPTDTPTISPTPSDTPTLGPTSTPTNTLPVTPTFTPTPPVNVCGNGIVEAANNETCDDGGLCVGGSNAGTYCTAESQCTGNGVCDVGPNYDQNCASSADCGGAACIHCKTFGGDGCAANCTLESTVPATLKPGVATSSGCQSGTSCAILYSLYGNFILPLQGNETFVLGHIGSDNTIPFVVPASSVSLPAIPISTLACACVRGIAQEFCGGYLLETDGSPATDCTFADNCASLGLPPCAYLNGPGNAAAGVIGCASGTTSFSPVDITVTQDEGDVPIPAAPTPTPTGLPNPVIMLSGAGGPGSSVEVTSIRLGQVVGACTGTDTTIYGPDHQFCTADDPDSARGPATSLLSITDTATGTMTNVYTSSTTAPATIGPYSTTGVKFGCRKLKASTPSVSGGGLAGAFTIIGGGLPGNGVVTNVLVNQ